MPMKLNVGVCRKIGQPDYGSLGASCNLEVELSGTLISDDPQAFHRHVREVYTACEQAVEDQLARRQQATAPSNPRTPRESPVQRNGSPDAAQHNGNGSGGRQATEKQLTYLRQLAGRIKGLGIRRLDTLASTMYAKPVDELTSFQASGMIDCLKGIKAGEIDLEAALEVFYRHRMLGVTLDTGEVAGRLEESWGQMVEEEGMAFGSADDEQSIRNQAGDLVRAYLAGVPADEPRPLAVEAAMEAPLVDPATGEDFGIPLVGIVDLVLDGDAGPIVLDFKTAARGGTLLEISHEVQLSSYA